MREDAARSALATPAQRIGREHLAFFKAATDGIPIRLAADRYLGEGLDLRVARSQLAWIGEALRVAALRHGKPGDARLIRIPGRTLEGADAERAPRRSGGGRGARPSFEEWRAGQEESFSDAELVAIYEAEFGQLEGEGDEAGARRRKRLQRERLRARQWEAFARLERLLVAEPNARDPVAAWFAPRLAERLARAGLKDLETLALTVNGCGYRWWVHVPRVGEGGARRVVAWLRAHEASVGIPIKAAAYTPRRQVNPTVLAAARPREAGIVPFEFLRPPAALDGRAGRNRADPARNKLRADNDYDAIAAWLRSKGEGTHTWRAYRKEAERFLLWAIFEAKKPLSSLDVEDCIAYRAFLADPQPAGRWVGETKVERFSIAWRPFAGPLSPASQRFTVTVLASMCEWLMRQRYLDANPWDGVPPLRAANGTRRVERSFTQEEWRALMISIARDPDGPAKRRLQAIVAVGYGTGLRLSELVNARAGHLRPIRLDGGARGWMLSVEGKGRRVREVPLPEVLLSALGAHLADRGLPEDPRACARDVPLLGALRPGGDAQRLSDSAFYKALKARLELAALEWGDSNAETAERFALASPHWLRHTHGSHALAAGVPLLTVKENLGHASLATTTGYLTEEEARRFVEVERFIINALNLMRQ